MAVDERKLSYIHSHFKKKYSVQIDLIIRQKVKYLCQHKVKVLILPVLINEHPFFGFLFCVSWLLKLCLMS